MWTSASFPLPPCIYKYTLKESEVVKLDWTTKFFIFSVVLYVGVTVSIKILEKRMRKKSAVVADESVEVVDYTMTNVEPTDSIKKTL